MHAATPRASCHACLLVGLLALSEPPAASAAERLYQWQDARTGHTQLAGRAPGWYRSAQGDGPRVLVFSGGRLVDDTALPVSDDLRRLLREEALVMAVREPADGPGGAAAAAEGAADAPEDATAGLLPDAAASAEGVDPDDPAAGEVVDARRQALEVIDRFDRARMAAAKAVVEALLPGEEPAPEAASEAPP